MSQIGQVRISHCFREANSCADFLARLGTHQDSCFVLHHDPPVDLLGMLSPDRAGVYHIRSIPDPPPHSLSLMQVPFYQKQDNLLLHFT